MTKKKVIEKKNMPELPEVEQFRRLLLPLVSKTGRLQLARLSLETKPPRKFLSDEDINVINEKDFCVSDVQRKGKLICLILRSDKYKKTSYLFVHMGMTGRISNPSFVPSLESLKKNTEYPPPYSYLQFSNGDAEACFSDPRKFGSIQLKDSLQDFDDLAPDALKDMIVHKSKILEKIRNQSAGIKGILLDQKRSLSGVGNWVADEVLYQIEMHPDQNFLTTDQANTLLDTLYNILKIAVECRDNSYPNEWLFHYRWNSKKTTKDAHGRLVTFITSGGRTSAIVPSIQKKKSQVKEENKSGDCNVPETFEENQQLANGKTKKEDASKTEERKQKKSKSVKMKIESIQKKKKPRKTKAKASLTKRRSPRFS